MHFATMASSHNIADRNCITQVKTELAGSNKRKIGGICCCVPLAGIPWHLVSIRMPMLSFAFITTA